MSEPPLAETPELDVERLFAELDRHGVRYVVIGGVAAVLHGSPAVTVDLDVVPATDRDNLERLSAALTALDARVWGPTDPRGVPFGHDARSLAEVPVRNLLTDAGRLDITLVPSGTQGYPDLSRDAVVFEVGDLAVSVASLADVIRSKEAAGREKDRLVLPLLRRLLEREREREGLDSS